MREWSLLGTVTFRNGNLSETRTLRKGKIAETGTHYEEEAYQRSLFKRGAFLQKRNKIKKKISTICGVVDVIVIVSHQSVLQRCLSLFSPTNQHQLQSVIPL